MASHYQPILLQFNNNQLVFNGYLDVALELLFFISLKCYPGRPQEEQLYNKIKVDEQFALPYLLVDGLAATQSANSDIIKLARSANRCAASVATARLLE